MRRLLICGNWKLHHSLTQTRTLVNGLVTDHGQVSQVDVVVGPVAPMLFAACEEARSSEIKIAAQNVFYERSGAYTGEWSVDHLVELGCSYCIVGHSERRQYFGESSESVAKKAAACTAGRIVPIVCVGETHEQRKRGEVQKVIQSQLAPVFLALSTSIARDFVIAYEPIWAIGTGQTANVSQAQEVHRIIRMLCLENLESPHEIRILYGGSVRPDNAAELMTEKDIDGVLVGGASLKRESFSKIISAALSI